MPEVDCVSLRPNYVVRLRRQKRALGDEQQRPAYSEISFRNLGISPVGVSMSLLSAAEA